ncbi:hypothetical protein [Planococcus versutus]|uniref:hypothetical protein n=1 Tax=Planococcus versutus TaxID=1302659 RepID=UPI000AA7B5B1|nr:hypothetical protein [Planococcus versutus]
MIDKAVKKNERFEVHSTNPVIKNREWPNPIMGLVPLLGLAIAIILFLLELSIY